MQPSIRRWKPVSYTHLDVYKRQALGAVGVMAATQNQRQLRRTTRKVMKGCLLYTSRKIPYTIIPGEEGKLRKDIFLERAIVEERMRLAMGLPTRRMDCLLYTSRCV